MTAANAVDRSASRSVDNFDPEWANVCSSGYRNLEQPKFTIAKRCDPRRLRTVRPLRQQSETRVGQDEQSLRVVVSKLSWAVASLVLGHDRALTPCGVRTPVDELERRACSAAGTCGNLPGRRTVPAGMRVTPLRTRAAMTYWVRRRWSCYNRPRLCSFVPIARNGRPKAAGSGNDG
jgi:hypothetical protein